MDRRPDAVSAMRMGTQDLHRALESRPAFARLLAPSVSVADYRHALAALLHSYVLIEPALTAGLQAHLPEHRYQLRLPLLRRDLDSLAHPSSVAPAAPLTTAPSLAETLGTLYVVEGSALGGRVVMKHLQERLDGQCDHAMAFYSLDGTLDPGHWQATRTRLNEKLSDLELQDAATESARQTFTLFMQQADRLTAGAQ